MLNFMSVRAQIVLVTIIFLAGLVGAGFYTYDSLEELRVNGPTYLEIVRGKDIVADVLPPPKYMIESILVVLRALGSKDAKELDAYRAWYEDFCKIPYNARHDFWTADLKKAPISAINPYILELAREAKDPEKVKTLYSGSYLTLILSRGIPINEAVNEKLYNALQVDSYKTASEFYTLADTEFFPTMKIALDETATKEQRQAAKDKAYNLAYGRMSDLYNGHRDEIDNVVGLATARNTAFERLAAASIDQRYTRLSIGAGIVLLFFVMLIMGLRRAFGESSTLGRNVENQRKKLQAENEQMQKNVKDLLMVVAEAADGDMTVRASVTEGTLGNVADAFNQMMESLASLIGDIKSQFVKTDAAIGQIRDSSSKMAAGANQQVQEIVDANAAVQRMSKDIEKVSQNAETAAAAARRTQESALAGSESVQNVIRGMESLRSNVQAGAKKIKNLGDRSMEITGIVATIAKISDQTNMLALNAAIEAARAGEHGRGFNVVADEVRQLAERTANATQEIEKLVKAIQAETNESVAAIEQQTQVVEEEAQIVGQAGDSLVKIQEVSTQSAELITDISNTARQQVQSALDVAKTMERVSTIARETQTGADRSSQLTGELATLSQAIMSSVGKFKTAGDQG